MEEAASAAPSREVNLLTRDVGAWRAQFPMLRRGARWVGVSEDAEFEGRLARRVVADISVNVLTVRGPAHAVERTRAHVEGDRGDDSVLAAVQLRGSSVLTTDRGAAVLRPGTHLVSAWDAPSRWEFPGDFTLFVARFPRSYVQFALSEPEAPIGEGLPASRGAGTVLLPFVRALARDIDVLLGRGGSRIARSLVDLFGASLLAAAPAHPEDLFERATAYLDSRIGDPGLDVDAVAQAVFVSRRRLQGEFAARGTTVTGWLRQRRLEGARADLADPHRRTDTISEIARSWGYPHPAHFSRLFARSFGRTPRRWRRENGAQGVSQ